MSGALKPGDRLPVERELSSQFAVSRTVIREAIRTLSGRGVVAAGPGRSAFVCAVDPGVISESLTLLLRSRGDFDYEHVHEARVMIETHAAGLAAERATPDQIDAIRAAYEAMERASAVAEMTLHDLEFHRAIARATQNDVYLVLHDALGGALIEVRTRTLARGNAREASRAHRDIAEHIANRDAVGARTAMKDHLDSVARAWAGLRGQGHSPQEPRGDALR